MQVIHLSLKINDKGKITLNVFNTNGLVYERMHGRTEWYAHSYSDEELKEVAEKIAKAKTEKAYVFFNNDSAMLKNSRKMLNIFKTRSKQ